LANRPEGEEVDVEVTGDEKIMAEKAVSKAQRAAAGIAYAAKKGDIPKSELRGASKEMAKMPSGELEKFAKTKEKGLPEKKKEESVEETTTAGSVATAPAEAPKGKKGMQFGKGVYESQIAESFENKLKSVLTEGMSINMSMGAEGEKSLTVTATDDDAMKLAQILKLAGMEQAKDYHDACPACGQSPCGCESLEEAELANSPDPEYADLGQRRDYDLSGGLNGPKSTGQTTVPVVNRDPRRGSVGPMAESTEQTLWDLYKKYDNK